MGDLLPSCILSDLEATANFTMLSTSTCFVALVADQISGDNLRYDLLQDLRIST